MVLAKRVLTAALGIIMVLGLTSFAFASTTISGKVCQSNGTTPINHINVWAAPAAGGQGFGGWTDSLGYYSFSVPAGSYRIGAGGSGGYVSEYYNQTPYWGDANIMTVSEGLPLTGINFTLDPGATISGHVYKQSGGTPINNENINVISASSDDGWQSYGAGTAADGTYSIVVPYGDWKVSAGGNTIYAVEYYNQKNSRSSADPVTVSEVLNQTDINFTLELGGTVSGRITDASGTPIPNVEINYNNSSKRTGHSTYSNSDGTYLLEGLSEGITRVTVMPAVSSGYAWSLEKYFYITLGETKANLNFVLKPGFLVSGYVRDPSGVGISNIEVDAESASSYWVDTDATGYYEMRLPAGTYGVGIWDDQYTTLPKILTVTGNTPEVNFTAYTSTTDGVTITGNITNSGPYPVTSGFGVIAFPAGATFDIDNFNSMCTVNEDEVSSVGGAYSLLVPPGVPPPQNYDVHFLSQNETVDGIQSVTVRGSEFNVPAGSTGKNFTYTSVGGTVTGTVNYDGAPILMSTVILTDSLGNFTGFTETDQNGTYHFYNVPAGAYYLQAINSEGVKTDKVPVVVTDAGTVTKNISYTSIPPMLTADLDGSGQASDVIIDFGPQYGIWVYYNNSSWSQLHNISPESMAAGNIDGDLDNKDDLIIDFGPQYGIWVYSNNSTWSQLHNLSAEQIVTADLDSNGQDDIIVDFGPQYGIWVYYNDSTWAQLHNISPKSMIGADLDDDHKMDLIVDFGPDYGIWVYYNNSIWVQLHNLSADSIVANDLDLDLTSREDIVVDFGDAYGIWIYYNNSTWSQLHNLSPISMALAYNVDSDLHNVIVDFGPSYGIWVYSTNSTWSQLHSLSADSIVTGDLNGNAKAEVIVDFGEPYGIWVYNDDGTWWQLHNLSP